MASRRNSFEVLLAFAIGCLVVGAMASSAHAAGKTYCAWDTLASPVDPSCELNFGWSSAGVNNAVVAAAEQDPGQSHVLIGPGTLDVTAATPIVIQPPSGEPVDVRGSGIGVTTLNQVVAESGSFDTVRFFPSYITDSTLSKLTVVTSGAPASVQGIRAQGGSIQNVRIETHGDSESLHSGLITEGFTPTAVEDSQFHVIGNGIRTAAWYVANNSTVTRSTFTATGSPGHENQVGVWVAGTDGDGSSVARLTKSSFSGFERSIVQLAGETRAQELLIELGTYGTPIGILAQGGDFGGDGLTIVGDALNAAGVRAQGSIPTGDPDVDISNTIIQVNGTSAHDVSCFSQTPGTASLDVRNSLHLVWSFGAALSDGQCIGSSPGSFDRSLTPAVFESGYRPAANSPVIDAGNSDSDRLAPKLDLAGNPRFVDGDQNGTAVIDIGAYEYQLPVPPGPPTVQPDPPGQFSLKFGKPSKKFKLAKRAKSLALGTAKSKTRIPVTTNFAAVVEFSLAKKRAGYKRGKRCVAKKPSKGKLRRCDLLLKGVANLNLPAGQSYLTFTGKWGRKKLARGKYVLSVRSPKLNDSPKAILNVVR